MSRRLTSSASGRCAPALRRGRCGWCQRPSHRGYSRHETGPCGVDEIEAADAPQIRERGEQHADEHHALDVAGPADLAERDGPREDERRFEIEDDEEHGDEIEARAEPEPGRSRRHDARLVRQAGGALAVTLSEQRRQSEQHDDEARSRSRSRRPAARAPYLFLSTAATDARGI